jgi:hypothetical protein
MCLVGCPEFQTFSPEEMRYEAFQMRSFKIFGNNNQLPKSSSNNLFNTGENQKLASEQNDHCNLQCIPMIFGSNNSIDHGAGNQIKNDTQECKLCELPNTTILQSSLKQYDQNNILMNDQNMMNNLSDLSLCKKCNSNNINNENSQHIQNPLQNQVICNDQNHKNF